MFQENAYREHLSLMLSEVLNDIGVNEGMVMKGRRVNLLRETMTNIRSKLSDKNITEYILGSQCEDTTTIGLNSDIDIVSCVRDINIIQCWSEWERGKINYLMIQDENTTPGYCFLQLLHPYVPLCLTGYHDEHHITDRRGRILLKSTLISIYRQGANQHHGPSIAGQGRPGFCDIDRVVAYPCKSMPQSASDWLDRQGIGGWPTQEMRRYAVSTWCFVVATGSKVSEYAELEWRISTLLTERCLMFSLNITQIRCYVLLKMILKSFLNPQDEINISSFMCKTVLFQFDSGKRLEHAAFKFLAPFLFTTYGSTLASSSIGQNNQVSSQALVWLSAGLNSDISSSRLKLASVFYSTGYMEEAEFILRHTEQQYYSYPIIPICGCWKTPPPAVTAELMRSTQDDMIHRDRRKDCWMDCAVVDSLPFLYFLQYKIYSRLQRCQEQQQAISKLIRTIVIDVNLRHRETAINILGQCLEQENIPQEALKCYLLSLQQRARNNAANFHSNQCWNGFNNYIVF
ncbi:uncharacterized protein LOC132748621 [Ruditapes philippinarum]|uniref:uncharacterized protein LOC132748621 n=1 Tax=Ruditapes philippinarum TaxID=129788 RepID=UPI00295B1715|nr:uncharacterized protein LOC132748621 [Ruditapes philippinarum]